MIQLRMLLLISSLLVGSTAWATGDIGKDQLQKTQQGPGGMDVPNPTVDMVTPKPSPLPKAKEKEKKSSPSGSSSTPSSSGY